MCACLCACVSVCTRVCALGIPSPPPPTGGSVRPSAWSARPGRHGPERTPSVETARGHSTSYPAGRAAPRPRHTPPPPPPRTSKKVRLLGLPRPLTVRVAAAGKEGSPAAQPSKRRLSPSIRLPGPQNLSSGEGRPPGRGPSGPRVPCGGRKERGAHLGAAHPGGSGPRARVRARGGCQRGWGRPEPGLRAMPSGRAALGECGAASPGRCRHRCLQCRLAED